MFKRQPPYPAKRGMGKIPFVGWFISTFMHNNYKNWIDRILTSLVRYQKFLIILFFMIIVFLYSLDVIRRTLTQKSITWVPSLALLLFSWLVFLGIGPVYAKHEDIAVSFFVQKLPKRYSRFVRIIVGVIVIGFFLFVLRYIPVLIPLQLQSDPVLPIPRYFFTLPLIIGAFTVILATIRNYFYEPSTSTNQDTKTL
jgi:TRAP-type C4-dicarboxylate transport system permease small subunit